MYTINKKPKYINNFKFNSYYFERGRDAFAFILNQNFNNRIILLPAYIGYSTKEGSGVFDPIKYIGINYKFYRFKKNLEIDEGYLIELINKNPNSILLLIHLIFYLHFFHNLLYFSFLFVFLFYNLIRLL